MTQQIMNGTNPLNAAVLDANFTELYAVAAVVAPIKNTNGNLGFGGVATGTYGSTFYNGVGLHCGAGNNVADGGKGVWITKDEGATYNGFVWQLNASFGMDLYVGNGSSGWIKYLSCDQTGAWSPGNDNAQTWGSGSKRWSVIYAGTGSINTSDAREKSAVAALTTAELAASKQLSASIGTYKWLTAIQAKGADARIHVGLTVQGAIAIMTANGLDPMAYGFICYDQWSQQVDSSGIVTLAAGDRYSLRPDELLMFIARGFDARLTAAGF